MEGEALHVLLLQVLVVALLCHLHLHCHCLHRHHPRFHLGDQVGLVQRL